MWCVSQINVVCLSYEWGTWHTPHRNEGWHYKCGMSHKSMWCVSHMNGARDTCAWIMSHIRIRRAIYIYIYIYINVVCLTNQCSVSHICMRHVTHMHELCCTYEQDVPHLHKYIYIWTIHVTHTWTSHVTHLLSSCSVLQCVAACCRALQGVAVRCSAMQCVAVRCRTVFQLSMPATHRNTLQHTATHCNTQPASSVAILFSK